VPGCTTICIGVANGYSIAARRRLRGFDGGHVHV